MGPLVMGLLLLALLDPVVLLIREDPGLPSAGPGPRLHVKFNPRTAQLTWDCQENATEVQCTMLHKEMGAVTMKLRDRDCQCGFESYVLHGGVVFTVTATVHRRRVSEGLNYTNPGGPGTAAENVSCVVYATDFMNCTWARGPAAPGDTQYFLYLQDVRRKTERECPRYVRRSGTHVGCRLDDLSWLTSRVYLLVNGSSRRAGVRFFDAILSLSKIERYSPPRNVTVSCNASHCLIRWDQPRTRGRVSGRQFQYQLDIRTQNDGPPGPSQRIEVSGGSENKYNFLSPEPRAGHTVRIRTADARILLWGDWSRPVAFGSEEWTSSPVYTYVLVVMGTVGGALIAGCLVKRFSVMRHLFPPIPRIKSPQIDQAVWDPLPPPETGKGSVEEVLTVQEVTEAATVAAGP